MLSMGTNQQLTTEQLELLKLIYDIEKLSEYIKTRDKDNDVTTDKKEIVEVCFRDIASMENINTKNKIKYGIKNIFNFFKKEKNSVKETLIEKMEYDTSKFEDCLEILQSYGYIENECDLTLGGKQRVLLYMEDLQNKKKDKLEQWKRILLETIPNAFETVLHIKIG